MKECEICNFAAKNRDELDQHVNAMHNKMFACKECKFRATCSNILKEHVKDNHMIDTFQAVFSCKSCEYTTIMENNLDEHMKYKHRQKRDEKPREIKSRSFQAEKVCIFWNNGYCMFGDRCTNLHTEIPACHLQESCRKNQCTFFHYDKSKNTFLRRSPGWRAPQKY